MPENVIRVEFPKEFLNEIKSLIEQTVKDSLQANVKAIQAKPVKYTRTEACSKLRISLPTLDKHLNSGAIKFQRLGKRILIDAAELENFLNRS